SRPRLRPSPARPPRRATAAARPRSAMLRDHPANERESPSPAVPRSVRIRRMKTTFIGLGNMGLPMARNLLQAGHALVVYNRTPARAQMLKQFGATVADGPAAAALGAEVLITMLGDDDAVEAMVLGDGGALAAAIEAIGEAFAFGRKHGIAPAELLDVVNGKLFRSPIYENYGKLIADERYEPAGFKLKYGLKDVRLTLAAAEEVAAPMPVAR